MRFSVSIKHWPQFTLSCSNSCFQHTEHKADLLKLFSCRCCHCPVRPGCVCVCVCVTGIEKYEEYEVARLENSEFEASHSETDENKAVWSEPELKGKWQSGRAEAKALWLIHQQQGSSDMNWTHPSWAMPLKHSTPLVWKLGEATRSAHTFKQEAWSQLCAAHRRIVSVLRSQPWKFKRYVMSCIIRWICSRSCGGGGVKCQGTNRSIFEKGAGATNLDDVQGESKGARLLIPNKLNQQWMAAWIRLLCRKRALCLQDNNYSSKRRPAYLCNLLKVKTPVWRCSPILNSNTFSSWLWSPSL